MGLLRRGVKILKFVLVTTSVMGVGTESVKACLLAWHPHEVVHDQRARLVEFSFPTLQVLLFQWKQDSDALLMSVSPGDVLHGLNGANSRVATTCKSL